AVEHAGSGVHRHRRVARGRPRSLTVADDGPGIPDRERAVLDSGTETQLEHGLGMGLWSINWAVTRVGGDLSVADNDPRGTVVTVRLYGTDPEF
ncbi:histidine kinase, partial [Halapricum sp. CBA1109]|uniref:ATP-binding protein n=1 Tax=Halapricum sp. CBA1109 TaxID=2668068 RepID=UPI0013B84814